MVKLAQRITKINPSATLKITARIKELKSQGEDIVNLAAGEPDFDTPSFIKESAIQAIKEGFTKYTPTTGILPLKKAISDKFKHQNNLNYSQENIIVSNGAKHCIYNVLQVLIDKKDEVLVLSPFWVSYPEMVKLAEGVPRFIETKPEDNFKIDPSILEKNINSKTKLLIINSPSNPTGSVYSQEELKEIARICVRHNIFVISDEIYEYLIYDDKRHFSIGSFNNKIQDLTITVNGVSKSFSMTGWRIGYLGAASFISEAIKRLQDNSTSNPCSISQKAALCALSTQSDWQKKLREEFQLRRDYIIERIAKIKKLSFIRPDGAFYIFCDISKTRMNSESFAKKILEDFKVGLIPGLGFGRDDFVRISFATSLQELKKGMDRLSAFAEQLPC